MVLSIGLGLADEDSDRRLRELEERVRELERAAQELRDQEGVDPARLDEIERQIAILAAEIEDLKLGEVAVEAGEEGVHGLGPAASKVYRVERGVSIGGYGEMLYEGFASERQDGTPSGKTDQLDFLRAVLYFGYKFNDRILFNSEIEYEHSTTGREGEVSLEFAYLDFMFRDAVNARAGLVLVPLGFINELHEPPIFLGSKRPRVEQRMIPTTWRENGAGVFGGFGRVEYRAYVSTALVGVDGTSSNASGFDVSGVRNGRSKGSKSAADSFAFSGRLDWKPVRGLLLGGAMYRGDAGQGQRIDPDDPSSPVVDAQTTIWDLHADYRWRGLQVRALYVGTSIDDAVPLTLAQIQREILAPDQAIGERQFGWYGEVGYDVLAHLDLRHALIPFVRYERVDTQDRVPEPFTPDLSQDETLTTVGLSWKPIPNIAIKVDYNRIENAADTGVDQINAALGFLF